MLYSSSQLGDGSAGCSGFDAVSIAKGDGCDAAWLGNLDAIRNMSVAAWSKFKPTVLDIPTIYPSTAAALTAVQTHS
jgi:hypothetical protein